MRVFALLLAMVLGAAGQEVRWPELRGIVHLDSDNKPSVILVLPQTNLNARIRTAPGPQWCILGAREANSAWDSVGVESIDAHAGLVKLLHHPSSATITLKLAGVPDGKYLLQLERAPLNSGLHCYQRLSQRTLIHTPQLSHGEVDLHIPANHDKATALAAIAESLKPHDIFLVPHGEKFAFAVSAKDTNRVAEFPPGPQVREVNPDIEFPPAMIKFVAADALQVIDFYSDLSGRTVLRPYHMRSASVTLQSETSLNREEAIWLIESALRLGGLVTIPTGEKFVYVLPEKRAMDLPSVALRRDLPGAAGLLKFVDVDRQQLLETYAGLLGRKPLPVEPNVPQVKISLRSQSPLTPGEAAFALENVAVLNGLALETRPDNKVALVPRAMANRKTN